MEKINTDYKCLIEVKKRIDQKKADYERYNFSPVQNDILKTFFDLAQEYTSLEEFYLISVVVLQEYMGVAAKLYLVNDATHELEFVCGSAEGLQIANAKAPAHIRLNEEMYAADGVFVVPIFTRMLPSDIQPSQDNATLQGMLEVEAPQKLTEQEKFFLGKFANRIAFNLYNRRIFVQNIKHLKFINTLVMDIEHNVIIPNMYFKHLFNRIRFKIRDVAALEKKMNDMQNTMHSNCNSCDGMIRQVSELHQDLVDYHQEMLRHHNNCSLFLESLFRRDHFEKGYLVLRSRKCFVEKEIIFPQLEHFARRFEAQGITIEKPADMAEPIPLRVDIGLLSQVYANYFSNAVKYTEEIINHAGLPRKAVAYGRKLLPDYFGIGKPGVKFNVFSTGPHLDQEESDAVFTEGFRGKNSMRQNGTGHGLAFVRQVVEMHGGEAGYEATEEGNNFFFILPVDER